MQIRFALSKDTKAVFQPDGRYQVSNKTGSILLTVKELEELKQVSDLAEQSRQDFIRAKQER